MARKKVSLHLIANEATRRATFKKRRKGLMKKASELATLCDVKTCIVVYGEGDAQPEVYPSVAEAVPILARFKSMPEMDQCKKMMNQEDFLRQRVAKLQEQVAKSNRENRERQTTALLMEALAGHLPPVGGITVEELTSLGWMVEMRLKNVPEKSSVQSPPDQVAPICAAPVNMDCDMGTNSVYQAPPQETGWTNNMVRTSGGDDLTDFVYSGFTGGFDGANNDGAGPSSSGQNVDMALLSSGFSWADIVNGNNPTFLPTM